MLNEHDDKYEAPDESEYHFSDEETNYETETETPKPVEAKPVEVKEGVGNKLKGSKRMLISLGVFLGLVLIVYKMVSPTSVVPSTSITAAPSTTQVTQKQPPVQVVHSAVPVQQPVVPALNQQPSLQPSQQFTQPSVAAPQAAQASAITQQEVVPQQTALPGVPDQNNQLPGMGLPSVIPVQSNVPELNTSEPVTAAANAEGTAANLSAESEKIANQMQSQYAQQLTNFSNENKALQNQVETLSSRVAAMEGQLNQLVQAISKPQQENNPPPIPHQAGEAKIAYTVQAIIPGRAWLKSENGETVTVTEGDMLKEIGRVTKIDPYDGVVEINTGTKIISVSYGNGN